MSIPIYFSFFPEKKKTHFFLFVLYFSSFSMYNISAVYGGFGEMVNTSGCEPDIRQFDSDKPPH